MEDDKSKSVAQALKEGRIELGLSLRKLACASGIDFHRIDRIERGSEIKLSEYRKLCLTLNLPTNL